MAARFKDRVQHWRAQLLQPVEAPVVHAEGLELDPELLARGGGKLFDMPRTYAKGWLYFCYAAGFVGGFSVATFVEPAGITIQVASKCNTTSA